MLLSVSQPHVRLTSKCHLKAKGHTLNDLGVEAAQNESGGPNSIPHLAVIKTTLLVVI